MLRITFQVLPQQHLELEKYAKKNKKSLSEYIRLRLFEPQTIQSRFSFYDHVQTLQAEIDSLKNQSKITAQYLEENQKSMTAVLNMLYHFMRIDIGPEKAKEIGSTVKKIMLEENQNGK